MARFFVNRPIVAMVLSIIIVLLGVVAMRGLPISQYPKRYEKPLGFGQKTLGDIKQIRTDVMKAAETRFTPEFRNRIDEIIVFSPLTMDEVRDIARLYLGRMKGHMERQGKIVEITDAAVNLLTEKGFSPAYGARFLKRHIDQKVKLPITNQWKAGMRFLVDAQDGEITVTPNDAFSLN